MRTPRGPRLLAAVLLLLVTAGCGPTIGDAGGTTSSTTTSDGTEGAGDADPTDTGGGAGGGAPVDDPSLGALLVEADDLGSGWTEGDDDSSEPMEFAELCPGVPSPVTPTAFHERSFERGGGFVREEEGATGQLVSTVVITFDDEAAAEEYMEVTLASLEPGGACGGEAFGAEFEPIDAGDEGYRAYAEEDGSAIDYVVYRVDDHVGGMFMLAAVGGELSLDLVDLAVEKIESGS